MPTRSKGARLWLRRARRDRKTGESHNAVWIIRDGKYTEGTGCRKDARMIVQELKERSPNTSTGSTLKKHPKGHVIPLKSR
jgi:hypothetical protein